MPVQGARVRTHTLQFVTQVLSIQARTLNVVSSSAIYLVTARGYRGYGDVQKKNLDPFFSYRSSAYLRRLTPHHHRETSRDARECAWWRMAEASWPWRLEHHMATHVMSHSRLRKVPFDLADVPSSLVSRKRGPSASPAVPV